MPNRADEYFSSVHVFYLLHEHHWERVDPEHIEPLSIELPRDALRTRSGRVISPTRPLTQNEFQQRYRLYEAAVQAVVEADQLWRDDELCTPEIHRFVEAYNRDCQNHIYIAWPVLTFNFHFFLNLPTRDDTIHSDLQAGNFLHFGYLLRPNWPPGLWFTI